MFFPLVLVSFVRCFFLSFLCFRVLDVIVLLLVGLTKTIKTVQVLLKGTFFVVVW